MALAMYLSRVQLNGEQSRPPSGVLLQFFEQHWLSWSHGEPIGRHVQNPTPSTLRHVPGVQQFASAKQGTGLKVGNGGLGMQMQKPTAHN